MFFEKTSKAVKYYGCWLVLLLSREGKKRIICNFMDYLASSVEKRFKPSSLTTSLSSQITFRVRSSRVSQHKGGGKSDAEREREDKPVNLIIIVSLLFSQGVNCQK